MIEDGQRVCDICGAAIPKGQTYRRSHVSAERATVFAAVFGSVREPGMRPTWTVNPDDSISLDACETCVLEMATIPGTDEMN